MNTNDMSLIPVSAVRELVRSVEALFAANDYAGLEAAAAAAVRRLCGVDEVCAIFAPDGACAVVTPDRVGGDAELLSLANRTLAGNEPVIEVSGRRTIVLVPVLRQGPAGLVGAILTGASPAVEQTERLIGIIAESASTALGALASHRNVEDALRESEARFRSVLESSLDAAYRRDLRTDSYDYMSPVIEQILGFTAEEFSRLSMGEVMDRIHPDDAEGLATAISIADRTRTGQLEYRFRAKDGSYRWLADHVTVEIGHDGRPRYRYGIIRDITSRKTAEEELRIAKEAAETRSRELAAALESIADGVVIYGRNLRILRMNRAAEELLGYGPDERAMPPEERIRLIGLEDGEGRPVPADEFPPYRAVRGEMVRGAVFVLAGRPHGGRKTWVSMSAAPIRNAAGEIAGAISISTDMTEHHELLQEKMRYAEELASARDRAEEANRAKSEFLAHMSHELRTPIGGIIGLSEVLKSRIREEENRELLTLMRDSAESLLAIIGDVLDLSKIEHGRTELQEESFRLPDELHVIVSTFRPEAERKGLELSEAVSAGVPAVVSGDRDRLKQVLRNLLSNAIKYTDDGEVRITMEPGREDGCLDGEALVKFTVSDTGIGIPAGKREELFQPFSRVHGSVVRKTREGTGLGLAISRRLVELMGGELTLEPGDRRGSIFTFTLPLRTDSVGAECEPVEFKTVDLPSVGEPLDAGAALGALRPLSVLLAEDDRINQVFLKMALEEAGHRVTVAGNGHEAVQALRSREDTGGEKPFDVVLMDIQMPEMDGLEATRAIRESDGAERSVPVVALTAFAMKGDAERFIAAGMDGYVTKPVNFPALARVLESLVEKTPRHER